VASLVDLSTQHKGLGLNSFIDFKINKQRSNPEGLPTPSRLPVVMPGMDELDGFKCQLGGCHARHVEGCGKPGNAKFGEHEASSHHFAFK